MTRRDWFYLAGQTALGAQDNPHADPQRRIAQIIRAYEEQGFHRTATNLAARFGERTNSCGVRCDFSKAVGFEMARVHQFRHGRNAL